MKFLIQWHQSFRWFLVPALTAYALWAWNANAGDDAVQQLSMSGDFENLRGLLEARGWRAERTPDGSTLLFPIQNAHQAWQQQPSTSGDFESLRSLLETRGWRTERTPDGSTLLFPIQNAPQALEQAPASITLTVSSEAMQQLQELLEAHSWNLIQKSSNAMHLQAPEQAHTPSTSTKQACTDEQQENIHTAGVKLPVNTAKEARQISANWLRASGYTQLGAADVHSFSWIYRVNIVDRTPPYRSRNELIINKRNGQVLALY